jgi:hypothetical protein
VTLREKQSLFVCLLGRLIAHVYGRGWELTLGEGYRGDRQGHMRGSLHYDRLAQDLNLFINNRWISDGSDPAWLEIGEEWERMHQLCRWGGRFGDANHFSLADSSRA